MRYTVSCDLCEWSQVVDGPEWLAAVTWMGHYETHREEAA